MMYRAEDVRFTQLAQLAEHTGPLAAERPAYASSPDGLAFQVGLWARAHGVRVDNVHASRGYTYILNGRYAVNMKGNEPVARLLGSAK